MEDITDKFVINLSDSDSSDEDNSDGVSESGTDNKDVKSFTSNFVPL
jgi:hypothetical protein